MDPGADLRERPVASTIPWNWIDDKINTPRLVRNEPLLLHAAANEALLLLVAGFTRIPFKREFWRQRFDHAFLIAVF